MRRPLCALGLSLTLPLGLSVGVVPLLGCGDNRPMEGEPPAVAQSDHRQAPRAPGPAGLATLSNLEFDERVAKEAALSAWIAVRERSRLLGRRGARGAIHGRLGPEAGAGWRWLIDDTAGQGALAARVQLVPQAAGRVAEGQRVLAFGAWHVAPDGEWLWRADEVVTAADAPAVAFAFEPGLAVGEIAESEVPAGARGPAPGPAGPVVLTVVAAPLRFGDGWSVAEAPDQQPVALLRLPGERRVYGGDELLGGDERWQLQAGQRYLVDSAVILQPRRADALPLVRAVAPPRRIVAGE